jgi:hypothetical protein
MALTPEPEPSRDPEVPAYLDPERDYSQLPFGPPGPRDYAQFAVEQVLGGVDAEMDPEVEPEVEFEMPPADIAWTDQLRMGWDTPGWRTPEQEAEARAEIEELDASMDLEAEAELEL